MSRDLLIEVGTEELPPKALRSLMDAFAAGVRSGLDDVRLDHGAIESYASPRRLAVIVRALAAEQADREVLQKGPPVSVAFDEQGAPTRAATAFADKCGVTVDELGREKSAAGEWLEPHKDETDKHLGGPPQAWCPASSRPPWTGCPSLAECAGAHARKSSCDRFTGS